MALTPIIAVHATAALGSVLTGAVALWARRFRAQRPKLHRAFGYAWVTLMIVTALSALFIRGGKLPNIQGFSPIHLLIPFTLAGIAGAFYALAKGRIATHRRAMQGLYFGASVGAGVFTLLPDRLLGKLVWGEWLGLLQPAGAPRGPVAQILGNTPAWVWPLFAGLLVLGWLQTRDRSAGLARIVLLPLGMGAFSLSGTLASFGASLPVLAAWLLPTLAVAFALQRLPLDPATRYDAATRRFQLPGSWVPMGLILGIFAIKYAVGAATAMNPPLRTLPEFAFGVALVSGVFSGAFAGRTLRLVRLAQRSRPALVPAAA